MTAPGRNRIAAWLALSALLLMTACSQVPRQGPIEHVEPNGQVNRQERIDVAPLPPAADASPELILEGFLAASENSADGYAVARQYLTPTAAKGWRPESGVTIYSNSSESKVVTTDGSAILRMAVIGRLDTAGHYTAVREPARAHDFSLTKIDGQWRIDNPGDGILLSQSRFERAYRAAEVYYLSPTGGPLIADQVFLPSHEQSPEGLVRALLAGPSDWLRPAVDSAFPPSTVSSGSWRDGAGVVHVNLSERVEALSADQRLQLATQLIWTLRAAGWGDRLTVQVGGRPLVIRGMDASGVLRAKDLGAMAPANLPSSPAFAIRDRTVVSISADANRIDVLTTQPQLTDQHAPGLLAVGAGGQILALTNEARTMVQVFGSGQPPSEPIVGEEISGLQFDARRNLWWVTNSGGQPKLWRRTLDGSLRTFDVAGLQGSKILAFRISPDHCRAAVIAQDSEGQHFGLLRLQTNAGFSVEGWRPIPLRNDDIGLTQYRDLAWLSATRLVVIASGANSARFVTLTVDVDGADVKNLGPLADVQPVAIAATPGPQPLLLLTEQGRLLRYEDQYRWTYLTDRVSTIGYPN